MSDKLTPITRKETFLAKAGGQNVVTPTPITREETFLQAIIDNGAGGGGGSDLPAVTSEDAGKVLTVSNDGEWVAGSGGGGGGGGVFVVGMDMQTMTLDKTWNEINSAPFAVIKLYPDENVTSIAIVNQIEIVGGEEYKLDAFTMGGGSPSSVTFVATSADGYPVMNMG